MADAGWMVVGAMAAMACEPQGCQALHLRLLSCSSVRCHSWRAMVVRGTILDGGGRRRWPSPADRGGVEVAWRASKPDVRVRGAGRAGPRCRTCGSASGPVFLGSDLEYAARRAQYFSARASGMQHRAKSNLFQQSV